SADEGARPPLSEERLELLVSNAADVIAVVDPKAVVTYISPSVTRMFGYEPAQVLGASALSFVHPEDLSRVEAAFAAALESTGPLPPIQFRAREGDNLYHDVEMVLTNLLDEPSVAGVVVNVRDVSDRTRVER